MTDLDTCLYQAARLIFPPAAANLVFESLHVCQGNCNIVAGSEMVGKYTAEAENLIPAFKSLGCVQDGWSESPDIVDRVGKYVKFQLDVDSIGIYQRPDIEDISD